jgi:flagellar protein FliO/FliZ
VTESFGAAVLKMGLWLGVVLGLLYLVAWGARRLGLAGAARGEARDAVRIVSRTAIDPRKSILIAHVRDRLLVLGVTPSEIRLLTELPPGSAADAGSAPASAISAPASFAARLASALRVPASS